MRDLTLDDLSQITGRHPDTLRRLARRGSLPGVYKLGGRWLISREAADRLRNVARDACEHGEGTPKSPLLSTRGSQRIASTRPRRASSSEGPPSTRQISPIRDFLGGGGSGCSVVAGGHGHG